MATATRRGRMALAVTRSGMVYTLHLCRGRCQYMCYTFELGALGGVFQYFSVSQR